MPAYRLTINLQKSAILPIYLSVKTPLIKLEVNIYQFLVTSSDTFKYLGIILDDQLNFIFHIAKITKQVARTSGILWKTRKFLSEKSLLNLYRALKPECTAFQHGL